MAMRGLRWESWTDTGPGGRPPCTASSGGDSRQGPSPSSTTAMPTPSPSSDARRESRREHGGTSARGPARVTGALGCPKSRERLCELVDECLCWNGEGAGSGFRERWSPEGRAWTVIGPGARTATLVAPPWEWPAQLTDASPSPGFNVGSLPRTLLGREAEGILPLRS